MQTNSPGVSVTELPSSSNTSTAIPSPLHCISPEITSSRGLFKTKHESISVPPDIDPICISELINLLIKSKLSGDNGEPVEHKHFRNLSWLCLFGLYPDFRTASMYFAEVPKRFIFSFSARSQSLLGPP